MGRGNHYVYSSGVTSNPTRDRVLDAAVDLLGTEGLRALTHARVDARAGVPKGSTSNYFRTRAALVEGTVERIVQQERPVVGSAYAATAAELADGLVALFEYMTGPNRVMTTARLALLMEAPHNRVVHDALARWRSTMEETVLPALDRMGARDARIAFDAITACFEGLFVQRLARGAHVDADRILHAVVGAFVGPDAARPELVT